MGGGGGMCLCVDKCVTTTKDMGRWYVCMCRNVVVHITGNSVPALPWGDSRGDGKEITLILCQWLYVGFLI